MNFPAISSITVYVPLRFPATCGRWRPVRDDEDGLAGWVVGEEARVSREGRPRYCVKVTPSGRAMLVQSNRCPGTMRGRNAQKPFAQASIVPCPSVRLDGRRDAAR